MFILFSWATGRMKLLFTSMEKTKKEWAWGEWWLRRSRESGFRNVELELLALGSIQVDTAGTYTKSGVQLTDLGSKHDLGRNNI